MEQVTGVEPAYAAWEAAVLPVNYTCMRLFYHFVRKKSICNSVITGYHGGAADAVAKAVSVLFLLCRVTENGFYREMMCTSVDFRHDV